MTFLSVLFLMLVIASILTPPLSAGQIQVYDLQQNFLNSGLATQFKLYFSLENGLGENAYIRLVWPYNLGYTSTSTWSTAAGSWGEVSDSCQDPVDKFLIQIKRGPDVGIYSYNIWLTDENNTQAFTTLSSGQQYMIFLQSAGPTYVPSTTGFTSPIGFYTVSNPNNLLYIVYDQNPVFGYLLVTAAPGTSMTSSVTSTNANRQVIAYTSYPITVTVTPTVVITQQFRIVFQMTNNVFDFAANTCAYTAGGLTLASSPVYSPGRVDFYFSSDLTITTHTFTCDLVNPNYVASGAINIMTMYVDANQVVEMNTNVGSLSTIALTWGTTTTPNANLNIYFGWGIGVSGASTTYPQPFRLFQSPSATEFTYNTVKFGFIPQMDTPTGVELILTMHTFYIQQFVIIQSTLVADLPAANEQKVSCTINSPATCAVGTPCNVIICTGVGPLATYKEYSISFKCYILSSSTVTTVDSNFGTISATDTSGNVIISAATPNIGSNTINVNPTLFFTGINDPTSANFRSFQYVSSVLTASPVNNPSSTEYGIQYYSGSTVTLQDIVFEHTLAKSMVNSGTLAQGDGIEIYTTSSLYLGGTLSCYSVGVTFTTCQVETVGTPKTTPALNFLLMRVGPNAATISTLFPSAATKMLFRFQNMVVNQTSSVMFADDGVFDFYARGAAGVFLTSPLPDVTTTTSTKNWLINTYVVQNGALANVKIGVSSFWSGTSAYLDGTMFPAFIYLTGYLTSEEKAPLQRLSVFFNFLDFFVNADGTVACSCPVSTLVCTGSLGHNVENYNPFMMNRVDIDLSTMPYGDASTNTFQIIIPVKTEINQMKITFGLAVLTNYQYYFSDKGYFDSEFLASMGEFDYSTLVNNPGSLSSNQDTTGTYRITKPASLLVGETDTTTLANEQSTTITANNDTEGYLYASVVYCGSWGWNQDDSFAITPIPNSPSTPVCTNVEYTSTVGTNYCTYCPIEEDLNNLSPPQTITNYIFPYSNGANMANAYTVFSTNRGMLIVYGSEDTTTAVMTVRTDLIIWSPLVTHPSVLYTSSLNNRFFINFTTNIGFPSNGIVSIESASSFGFTYGSSTASALFDGQSCALNTLTTSGFECQLAASVDYTSGTHNLTVTGIDITGAAQVYSLNVIIQTSSGSAIQKNAAGLGGSYSIVSGSLTMSLEFSNFSIANSMASTILSFDFLASKYTFSTESYVFNLGAFATANSANTISCQVTSGGAMSWLFQSCDVSNLAAVTLVPVQEFWPDTTINSGYLTIVFSDGVVPSAAGASITGTLNRGSQVVETYAAELALPTISTSNSLPASCTISKTYKVDGSTSEFQLSITPTQSAITNPSSIYLKFPYYYSDGLSSKGMFYCTIDGDPVYCQVTNSRWLVLQYFIRTYAVNTAHAVNIYGIDTVVQPTTPGNIFIGIDYDSNPASVQEQIYIVDPTQSETTSANVGGLQVYNLTISTTTFRVSSTYTVTFTSPSSAVASGDIIVIDFPADYSNLLEVPIYQPSCTLAAGSAPSTYLVSSCAIFGLRLKITLTAALATSTSYIIQISNVRNPDTAYCKSNKLVISIVSSDQNTVYYRSNPDNINANWISFNENSTLNTLVWSQSSTDISLTLPIQLINGMYSQSICLEPSNTKFSEDLLAGINSLYTNNFSIDVGTNATGMTGALSTCFRIAPTVTTPATYYDLIFDKLEEFPNPPNFTAVPRLAVQVLSTVITIAPQETTYSVPFLGKSVPIILDFSVYTPKDPLTITAKITDTTVFNFASASSVIVNVSCPIAYFFVKTTTTTTVGSTTTLTFTMSGLDTVSYTLSPAAVSLVVIDQSTLTTDTPIVTLGAISTSTMQEVTITTAAPATIYWGIAFTNTFMRPCEYIQERAFTFAQFNFFDPAQEQFGFIAAPDATATITITNLMSNKDYTLSVCTDLLNWVTTGPIITNFTSIDNNILIVTVEFTFESSLSVEQELDFACFLASEFLVYKINVVSQNSRTCQDKFSQRYIPPFYQVPPRMYLPAPVDTSAETRRRVLNVYVGDSYCSSNQQVPTGPSFEDKNNRRKLQTTNTSSDGTMFFLISGDFRSLSTDTFYVLVEDKMNAFDSTALSSDRTFLSDIAIFVQNNSGFPSVISGTYDNQISSFTPGFQTFPAIEVLSGIGWLALTDINLEDTGYVYGIADDTNQSAPNSVQIRYNLTYNNTNASGFQLTSVASGTQGVLNITGLANYTNYTIYYFSTNQDLGIFAVTSGVNALNGTTAIEPPTNSTFASVVQTSLYLVIGLLGIVFIY